MQTHKDNIHMYTDIHRHSIHTYHTYIYVYRHSRHTHAITHNCCNVVPPYHRSLLFSRLTFYRPVIIAEFWTLNPSIAAACILAPTKALLCRRRMTSSPLPPSARKSVHGRRITANPTRRHIAAITITISAQLPTPRFLSAFITKLATSTCVPD